MHTAYPLLLEAQEQRRTGQVTSQVVSAKDLWLLDDITRASAMIDKSKHLDTGTKVHHVAAPAATSHQQARHRPNARVRPEARQAAVCR